MEAKHRPVLRLAHSPDPDDAFMWWPLFACEGKPPRIDTGRFRFEQVTADIETLNQRSGGVDSPQAPSLKPQDFLEITAISCAQYPRVQDRYVLTACGASMGEQYGPKLVSKQPMQLDDLRRKDVVVAVPGTRTSAFATLSIMLGRDSFGYEVVPFEEIILRVKAGDFAAGLIIHEGQLTFESAGLNLIEDLGAWWWRQHGLPLPLGVNVIRRDLEKQYGAGTLVAVTSLLQRSVEYALAHREESVRYALRFARDMKQALADEFIRLYVNKWTLNFGDTGRRAVERFLQATHAAGLTPAVREVDFVSSQSSLALPSYQQQHA